MTERYVQLATSENSSVTAPAGCGKTEEIILAVNESKKPQLVLTHTHAGVGSLRKRFNKYNIKKRDFFLETIASWSLKFCSSYPKLSNYKGYPISNEDYEVLYQGFLSLLDNRVIQKIISKSYQGAFIDEYQDCSLNQHKLICKLSEIIPCRILGDPLQGIFDFDGQRAVNWDRDVNGRFQLIYELETPHRWKDNPKLADDLIQLRSLLLANDELDLQKITFQSIKFEYTPISDLFNSRREILKRSRHPSENTVALMKWNNNCHALSRVLFGFVSIEEMECRKLFSTAESFNSLEGFSLGLEIISFCQNCLTKVSSELQTIIEKLKNGDSNISRIRKNSDISKLLLEISINNKKDLIFSALQEIKKLTNVRCFRPDLFFEMSRAAKHYNDFDDDFVKSALIMRNQTRHFGRREHKDIVTTPLLFKGLETDHCIILYSEEFTKKEFYVSATRGKKTLKICYTNPNGIIKFSK